MKKVCLTIIFFALVCSGLAACSFRQSTAENPAPASSHEEKLEDSSHGENSLPVSEEKSVEVDTPESEVTDEIISQDASASSMAFSMSEHVTTEVSSEPQNVDVDVERPIDPWAYQTLLGKGMDVDWSKTNQGRKYYNTQSAVDFAAAGISHVRIRIADKVDQELLEGLDRQIRDCLDNGIIPVIAYQAAAFKNDPSDKNIEKVVAWWSKVAEHYQDASPLLSFDLLIEATDSLNKQPEKLNEIYELLVTEIRKTNPTRIIMISPRLRSDAAYLQELKIPTQHNGYLMAEWHFYASGSSKTNARKLWTSGTKEERALIDEKIALALAWQNQTNVPTWVGAWMPGNYNDGDDYSIDEQIQFAGYMTEQLTNAGIPFAVNSDTKFYDREKNQWIAEMQPVFDIIYQ